MLYGIVNIVCFVWLWCLAWKIGRGTSDRSVGHFWKSFGIACASSAVVKFLGAVLSDARTPIASSLLNGLFAGLVGMVVVGLAVSALAWCIARLFRVHAPLQPSGCIEAELAPPIAKFDSQSHSMRLLVAFILGLAVMGLVQGVVTYRTQTSNEHEMAKLVELLELVKTDIHQGALPTDIEKWLVGGPVPSEGDGHKFF
jgi:hypothetical protein